MYLIYTCWAVKMVFLSKLFCGRSNYISECINCTQVILFLSLMVNFTQRQLKMVAQVEIFSMYFERR